MFLHNAWFYFLSLPHSMTLSVSLFWNMSPLQGYWHLVSWLTSKINVLSKTNVILRHIITLWKTTRKQPDPNGLIEKKKKGLKAKVKQIACYPIIHGDNSSSFLASLGEAQELFLFRMEIQNLDESICLWHILTRKIVQKWLFLKSSVTI